MDDTVLVHLKGQVSCDNMLFASYSDFWQTLAMQGCVAYTTCMYEASAPVIEILQDYCDHFGLSSAACKLSTNTPTGQKEVSKNKLLGQVLLASNLLFKNSYSCCIPSLVVMLPSTLPVRQIRLYSPLYIAFIIARAA